jgi:type IX secretion system PorP/SprF family membrane protein
LGADFNFTPSILVKKVDPAPVQFEFNAKFQYLDVMWIGGGYRVDDGINAMLGLNISNTVNMGYSYDYTTSKLNNFSRGTHEIMIGFTLGNKYGDSCPRNVW